MLRKLIFFAITSGLAKKAFTHLMSKKTRAQAEQPAGSWSTVLKEQAGNRDYTKVLQKEAPTRSPLH